MEAIPLCPSNTPQLILQNGELLAQATQSPALFAAALAPDADACAAWREALSPLPVGLTLHCPPPPDEEEQERPRTATYIERCKAQFRAHMCDKADFYYLHGAQTFSTLRAAVLALTDLCGQSVVAELEIYDDEGHLHDGTEARAAIGVLQRIGVTTIVLSAQSAENLRVALAGVAPYARLSIGAAVRSQWLSAGVHLPAAELLLAQDGDDAVLRALAGSANTQMVERDHDDFILAPDGRNAHFIDATINISDEIECGHRLEQALIDAEDDAGALKLVLETEEDVVALEEHRYMISRPVCLCSDSAELLEQGLRVYPGLALYDGTWEQDEQMLQYWEHKYGLIRL